MKRSVRVVATTLAAGLLGYCFGWTGVVIVTVLSAVALAWTFGRAHEVKVTEKRMATLSLEAFSEAAEEVLANVPDDLDEAEEATVAELQEHYHVVQRLLAELRK